MPFISLYKKIGRTKTLIGVGVIVALAIGGYVFFSHRGTAQQFVTVKKDSISQTVSLTGNSTPAQSVALAFGSSGIIARTNGSLGKQAFAGQVLAEIDVSDAVAQIKEAQANLDAQVAKLQGIQAGSRPEDIATSQATVDKAQQDLTNMYAGISDTSVDSYTKANDAVRTQLDSFFSNAETNPKLTYVTSNSQAQINAEQQRLTLSNTLTTWQQDISNSNGSLAKQEMLLQGEIAYLSSTREFIGNISKTLENAPGLSPTTLSSYKLDVSSALAEVNTATRNLNTISQNIASQKLIVSQAQAQLALKKAGSSSSDIAVQQAQVAQAQAAVNSAEAKIRNAQIIAPISGVITQFDAKVGQLATPSSPLISIISSSGYEVDAGASETDVGKIALGDKVTMTLDAFPGETFNGTVFYIAPSNTNTQGVVNYQIKVSFDKSDSRIKNGLTANMIIQTNRKDNVFVLPQYAILQNDMGTFVEVVQNKQITQVPVTLGIQDQNGNVEILSGVKEGEQVLNIGLK